MANRPDSVIFGHAPMLAAQALLVFDADARLMSWNGAAPSLLGIMPDGLTPGLTYGGLAAVVAAGSHGAAELLPPWPPALEEPALLAGLGPPTRLRRVTDGRIFLATLLPLGGRGYALALSDATHEAQRQTEQRLQISLGERIARAESFEAALESVIHSICRHAGWQLGESWLPDAAGARMHRGPTWHTASAAFIAFDQESARVSTPDASLVGRIWRSGRPELIADLAAAPPEQFLRRDAALSAGLRTVIGIPLAIEGRILAVCVFYGTSEKPRDRFTVDLVLGLAPALHSLLRIKSANDAVATANRQLAELLESVGEAIISIDSAYRIIGFNREAERLFGYSRAEALGQPLDILLPESARDVHLQHVRGFAAAPQPRSLMGERPKVRGRHKDGREFFVEAALSKLDLGSGLVLTAVLHDVTDRHRAEEALRESEARYRDLTELASDWEWEMDAELRYTSISERFAELTGVDPSRAIGRRRWELGRLAPDEAENWRRHREDLLAHRPFLNFRYSVTLASGQRVYRRVSGKPRFDPDGRFRGYRGVAYDETAEVEVQERAKRVEALLTTAVEGLTEGFALFDVEDRLVLFNRRMREIYGKDNDLLQPGRTFEEIVRAGIARGNYPAAKGSEEAFLAERVRTHRSGTAGFLYQLADGRWFDALELHTANGYIVSLRTDVTERVTRERALRESEARQGAAFDQTTLGMAFLSTTGAWLRVNGTLCAMLGCEAAAFPPLDLDVLTHPADREIGASDHRRLVAGEIDRFMAERRLRRKNKQWIWASLTLSAIHYGEEGPRELLLVVEDITKRKHAERKLVRLARHLAEKNRQLDLVLSNASNGLTSFDARHRLVLWNPRYLELFGLPPDALHKGMPLDEVVRRSLCQGKAPREAEERALAEALATVRSSERRIFHRKLSDGRYLEGVHQPLGDGGAVHTFVDITERKQAERKLIAYARSVAEKNRQLDLVLENSSNGLVFYDAEDRIVLWNRRYMELYGHAPDAIRAGMTMNELLEQALRLGIYPKETAEQVVRDRLAVAAGGRPQTFIQRLASGSVIEIMYEPLVDGGSVVTFTDITEREEVAHKLVAFAESVAEKNRQLDLVLENSSNGIAFYDAHQRLQLWNHSYEDFYSLPHDALRPGMPLAEVMELSHRIGNYPNEEWPRIKAERLRMAAAPERGTFRQRLASGRIIEGTHMPLPGGGAVSTYSDITERERRQAELIEAKETAEYANRAKSDFLANISHELRTPLNAIIGFSEMLTLDYLGPLSEKQREYLRDIRSSGTFLLSIIDDILDLTKIEASKEELDLAPIRLADLADGSARMVRQRFAQDGANLAVRIPPNLPMLMADARKLRQVLINLLTNAFKFTPADGRVTLTARLSPDDWLEIEVADTGIGIADFDLPHIMEPFYRASGPFARQSEGSGLGLPLAKALVELHGGQLRVDSKVGEGTAAIMRLPPACLLVDEPP